MSYLRVSIDAQSGDPVAHRILWFCQNPSDFVVTSLIGNNVAHYGLTVAVGIAAVEAGLVEGMTAESRLDALDRAVRLHLRRADSQEPVLPGSVVALAAERRLVRVVLPLLLSDRVAAHHRGARLGAL